MKTKVPSPRGLAQGRGSFPYLISAASDGGVNPVEVKELVSLQRF